jgi:DNA-binding NarL/FixJ family response regulator
MKIPSPPSISVCIVEDELETLQRLEQALKATSGLEVLCCAMSCRMAIDFLRSHVVDVLLVDLGLPDGSGLDVIRFCRSASPVTEVMVITMFGDEANMIEAFEAGARGYLLERRDG